MLILDNYAKTGKVLPLFCVRFFPSFFFSAKSQVIQTKMVVGLEEMKKVSKQKYPFQ